MTLPDTRLVPDLFDERAKRRPAAIAVADGTERISYGQLARETSRLAQGLRDLGVGRETVVGVCLSRGTEVVRGLLAVMKAGGAYLPLDPSLPPARLARMCEQARPAIAVTDDHNDGPGSWPSDVRAIRVRELARSGEPETPGPRPGDLGYVICTSGSTGPPKAVGVSHGALARAIPEIGRAYQVSERDRIPLLASVGFDTSIEQILVTLLSGATLIIPDRMIAPAELPGYLNQERLTVVDLTPAYWHRMLASVKPDDERLRTLRLMITGGDAASPGDCAAALAAAPHARMLNAYGLTETTITSTLFEITSREETVPVGKPLPHATIRVLDGEVYIGGPALAREYLGQPELTAERFVTGPDGQRLFRTGDRGRLGADGNLEITGRVDRQLKIRGFRVEPAEIENVLAAHPAVDQVEVRADELAHGDKRLTAYYTARTDTGRTDPKDLDSFAKARLPGYMVPSAFLPLNHEPDQEKTGQDERYTPTQAGMSHLWARLLRTDRAGLDDDFFRLGGNSLLAAELLARVRVMFGVGANHVRPLTRALLRDPTLRGFSAATEDARAGRLGTGDAADDIDFVREAALDVPVITARNITARKDVLLTGATGFIGIHLLRELLTSPDTRVHCLVRANDAGHAGRRIAEAAARYEVGDLEMERVVMVPGDLGEPEFGLPAAEFDELARTIDVVYHCGATVNFIYPYEELRAVNVGGTREVIRLAGRYRGIPVHYVSSAAVLAGFGVAGVRAVTEDQPLAYPDRLCVGYVQTKYVAEELLRAAARNGLPVSVYRPMDVVGASQTGAWNVNAEMRALIRFIADTGAAPDISLPLDFVAADTFAAALVQLSRTTSGGTFHLTAPRYVRLGFLVDRLRRRGYRITELPYREWVRELLRHAASDPSHPMTPFVPLFVDHCPGTDLTIAEMYADDVFPAYSAANTERALRGSGITIPDVGAELIDRHIEHLIANGFLTDGR